MRPVNRHLLIKEKHDEQEDAPLVIMPSTKHKFTTVKILKVANDCTLDFTEGESVVVLSSMIERFTHDNKEHLLVPQTAVMAVL